MLIIIASSVLLRLPVYRNVQNLGDGRYIDSETGIPYLTEMDSYYHLRMTSDILNNGHPGDSVVDGSYWDSLSYAPEGRSVDGYRPLMAYIAIGVFKFASCFAQVSLEQIVYWLNVFISSLVVIPVFLLAYEMSNIYGACVAAIISTLNYGYLIHTVPGFYDTDGVITWVSCFFLYFGCKTVKSISKKDRKSIIFFGVCLLISAVALYNSWYIYYMFVFLLAGTLFLYAAVTFKKDAPKSSAFYAISSIVLIFLLFIAEPGVFKSIFSLFTRIYAKGGKLFPDIFVSISEMRKPSLIAGGMTGLFQMKVLSGSNIGIINAVGGSVPFIAALVMLILTIRKIVKKDIFPEHILLVLWFIVTIVLAFRGWRFIMLFALPVAILSGNLTGEICALMDKGKMMDRGFYKIALIAFMTFPTLYGSYRSYADSQPSVYADMGDAMITIRENTPPDTILISWWDYGYFFEEKAQRRTLFDGGSQSGIRSYWVAKALSAADERFSSNIFRMLSASGDEACEQMLASFGESEETLVFMDELLMTEKEEACEMLSQKGIDHDSVIRLVDLLFPDTLPPMQCIITPDMIQIAGWFAEFSSSDENDTLNKDNYAGIINRIAVAPPTGINNVYKTDYGLDIIIKHTNEGLEASTAVSGKSGDQPYPVEKLILVSQDQIEEYVMHDISEKENTFCIIMDLTEGNVNLSLVTTPMADSVFGRLYYCHGAGLKHYEAQSELSNSVQVYNLK